MIDIADRELYRLALASLAREFDAEPVRIESIDVLRREVQAGRLDALICDPANEPGDHWREILGWLRAQGQDLPVIGVSDRIDEEQAAQLIRLGVRAIVNPTLVSRIGPILARELGEARHRRLRELRVVIDSSPDPMLIVRVDGRIYQVNSLAEKLLGYREAELAGHPVELLVPHDLRQRHVADRTSFAAAPQARPMGLGAELVARHKDGSSIPVEISLGPVRLGGEQLICCGLRDLRERKRTERLLLGILEGTAKQTGERFLRSLVKNLALALDVRYAFISEIPREGGGDARVLAFWNATDYMPPFQYALQGTPCEAVVADAELLVPQSVRMRYPGDPRLEALGVECFFGVRLHADSSAALGLLAIADVGPLADERIARVVMGIFAARAGVELERMQAGAALAESEARFRTMAELSSDYYWEQDENFRFTRRIGLERESRAYPANEVIGKTRWELPGQNLTEPDWQRHRADLEAHRAFRDLEIQRPLPSGESRWISVSGSPFFDADGRFRGYRGVGKDITQRKQSEDALREGVDRLRLIADNVPAMIAFVDADFRYGYANRSYIEFYGEGDRMEGKGVAEALGAQTWQAVRPGLERAMAGVTVTYVREHRRRSGRKRQVEVSLVPHFASPGRVLGVYVLALDITKRRRQDEALRLRDRALDASVNSVMIAEPGPEGLKVVYANRAFERLTGYSVAEVIGKTRQFLHRDDVNQPGLEALRAAVRDKREGTARLRNYRKDGSMFWLELCIAPVFDGGGAVTHYVSAGSDVTERVRYEEEIERHANYDGLTGLANRNLLNDRLKHALANAARAGRSAGVLYIDIDHLKRINDSLGHMMGDAVIAQTGMRLAAMVRTGDTVARVGGDEFVVVLADLKRADEAALVAQKAIDCISAPLRIQAHEFVLTASVGIAVFPTDGADAATLLRNADTALYRAKEEGRDCFRYFAAEMNERLVRFLAVEKDLRRALDGRELWLQYQPIVRLATGECVGTEALVRWRRSDGTVVHPAQFIPVAEESGLIVPMGRWILEAAMQQAALWNGSGAKPVYVSVNLSARQFRDPMLVETVRAALETSQVDPSLINLEITESAVMHHVQHSERSMRELKRLGVRLSVDDFGTGYSSLAYLKRFPIDTLKIDRSFVSGLPEDRDDLAICRAVIDLARGLGMDTIAEGIETHEQSDVIFAHGGAYAQGYYFGRPADPDQFR